VLDQNAIENLIKTKVQCPRKKEKTATTKKKEKKKRKNSKTVNLD